MMRLQLALVFVFVTACGIDRAPRGDDDVDVDAGVTARWPDDGFGNACTVNLDDHTLVDPCLSLNGVDGMCVQLETGVLAGVCRRHCRQPFTSPRACPPGQSAVPTIGADCYCEPEPHNMQLRASRSVGAGVELDGHAGVSRHTLDANARRRWRPLHAVESIGLVGGDDVAASSDLAAFAGPAETGHARRDVQRTEQNVRGRLRLAVLGLRDPQRRGEAVHSGDHEVLRGKSARARAPRLEAYDVEVLGRALHLKPRARARETQASDQSAHLSTVRGAQS